MNKTTRTSKVQFVAGAQTWDEVKTELQKTENANSFLNVKIYYDENEAILKGKSGTGGSRSWGQWVLVITPSDRVYTSAELASIVPEMKRTEDELQLPAIVSNEKMKLISTTRTLSLTDDQEWADDNGICIDCLGPDVLFDGLEGAVVIIDKTIQSNQEWIAGGNQPGSYVNDFDVARFKEKVAGKKCIVAELPE